MNHASRSTLAEPVTHRHGRVEVDTLFAEHVPPEIDVVPTYLRCRRTEGTIRFEVAECSLPDPRETRPGVDELAVERRRVIDLEFER